MHQDKVLVEHYRRQPDQSWVLRDYRELTDAVSIPSIDASPRLAAIFEE